MIKLRNHFDKFDSARNVENELAYFLTPVPWVAPDAYLNVVWKGANPENLKRVGERVKIPAEFRDFLRIQNGAVLFSDALSIFGVHEEGQLLNRNGPLQALPFNIEEENENWLPPEPSRFLAIGAYGFNGSRVCVDRTNGEISLFPRDACTPAKCIYSWRSIGEWLKSEIERLSTLFDRMGCRLVDQHFTVPATMNDT